MRVNRRGRRFHDPWGNKNGNCRGYVTGHQYMVAKCELRGSKVAKHLSDIDLSKQIDATHDRFVKGSRVEALRR